MGLLTSNFVKLVVFSTVGTGDTTIQLASAGGLPDVSAPEDFTYVAAIRLSDESYEIMKVTDVDFGTDIITVERAQEGTVALAFSGNDQIRNFFTSGMFDQFAIEADATQAAAAAALASETYAATSETNAATSENNALTSENNASTSETNAGTSETNAATSETNAGISETNAADSAAAALVSETNAADSAAQFTKATTSEAEAGVEDTHYMTAAKTADAIAAQAGGGGILPETINPQTGNYTVLAGDVTSPITEVRMTDDGDNIITLDVSLLADSTEAIAFSKSGTGIVQLVVSNTGTMTFLNGPRTDFFITKNSGMLTINGDTATNANVAAGY